MICWKRSISIMTTSQPLVESVIVDHSWIPLRNNSHLSHSKLETQKLQNDPYEFDSILKSQDSPIDRQQSFVPRMRP